MRKTITKLFGLVIALFASQGIMAQTESELLLDEPFVGSFGSFTVEGSNGLGNDIWLPLEEFAQADACGKIQETESVENYLVSPEINLASNGVASFEFYWRYFNDVTTQFNFVVREVGGQWQSIVFEPGESITWNQSGDLVIPESFNGKKIQVAFKYAAPNSADAGQLQIKNLKVYGVKGSETEEQVSSDIDYPVSEITYTMGSGDFNAPVLDNPYGVEVNYESSDVSVASVDAQGVVTINGIGVTTIKATSVETPKYLSATTQYVLTVQEGTSSNVIFEESFKKGFGEFTVEGFNGIDPNNPIWVYEGFAKADAYDKITEPVVNYLVSPVVKLDNSAVVAHFDQTVDYFANAQEETGLCIRTAGGEWKALTIPTYPAEPGMVVNTGNIEVPAEYKGLEVQFAFKYTAQQSDNAGVWGIQNFVVEKTASKEKVDPEISYDVTSIFYILESDFTEPVLNNPNNVNVSYSSSDNAVATVDEATGEVTAVAEGKVTITATAAESDKYLAGEASYTITVTGPAVTEKVFEETFETSLGEFTIEGDDLNIWFHDVAFATADGYDKVKSPVETYLVSPVITLAEGFRHIAHYAQSQDYFNAFGKETAFVIRTVGGEWTKLVQPNIATKGNWSETGNIQIPEEFNGKDVQFAFKYTAKSGDTAGLWSVSNFVVEKVLNGTDPKLSYATPNAVAFKGQVFTAPALENPYGVEVTYSSSNPEVAEVDAQTGSVLVLAEGKTTITATSIATETFVSGTASYELTVNAPSSEDVVFEAYFDDNLCGFTVEGFNGDELPIWKTKNGTARADAFTKVSGPTVNYLVSPVIMMDKDGNKAEFNYQFLHDANAKVAAEDEFGFCIREIDGEWEELIIPNVDATNTMVSSGEIIIPEAYSGKKVQVAFKYFAESGNTSGVFSIDDIVIKKAVPTCIEGITADDLNSGKVYDMQGRRVNKLVSGVYIVNGKKVVIR